MRPTGVFQTTRKLRGIRLGSLQEAARANCPNRSGGRSERRLAEELVDRLHARGEIGHKGLALHEQQPVVLLPVAALFERVVMEVTPARAKAQLVPAMPQLQMPIPVPLATQAA